MSGRGSALTAGRHDISTTLAEVRRGLQAGERLILVTGKVGAGKTSLCRSIAAESDDLTFVSTVAGPCRSAEEMLTQVLGDFGVVGADRPGRTAAPDRHQLLITFQRFLASLAPLGGRALLIVDEAHYLLPAVLERIGQWTDLDPHGRLQIVIAGHPVVEEILKRPELRVLYRRIERHCELPDYVVTVVTEEAPRATAQAPQPVVMEAEFWRVRFAPAGGPLAALRRGTPRLVNALTHRSPVVEYEAPMLQPGARAFAAPSRAAGWLTATMPRARWPIATAAVLALLAAGSWTWQGASSRMAGGAASPMTQDRSSPDAAPAAAPSVAPAVLPTGDSVSVNIALYRSQQRATAVAAQLVDAGFPAFTRSDSEGFWHQVIVGPYVSAEEALAAQAALREHGVTGTELRVQNLLAGEVGR